MQLYIYLYIYICIHTYIHAYIYTCMRIYYIYIYVQHRCILKIRTYIHIFAHNQGSKGNPKPRTGLQQPIWTICLCVCVHDIYIHTYIRTYIHIHTYTHTYTNAYIRIYAYSIHTYVYLRTIRVQKAPKSLAQACNSLPWPSCECAFIWASGTYVRT
jgi:hypothetical protein